MSPAVLTGVDTCCEAGDCAGLRCEHFVQLDLRNSGCATLAAAVGGSDGAAREVDAIPDMLALLLGQESWDDLAGRFVDRHRYWFVGGGPNTATAYEAALKMGEAAHATAAGFNCEQFLHGAWAALEAEDAVFLVAPPGPSHERCLAVARVVKEIGAPLIALAREDDREIPPLAAETIAIPAIDELLSPILSVVDRKSTRLNSSHR